MEFMPLRNLQRGRPEVWEALERENGRLVLTRKGQPAYLLVDLDGHDLIPLVTKFDTFNSQNRNKKTKPATVS